MAKENKAGEAPNLESQETVKITFEFPSTTVVVSGVTKGRAKSSCKALCKKFAWTQE